MPLNVIAPVQSEQPVRQESNSQLTEQSGMARQTTSPTLPASSTQSHLHLVGNAVSAEPKLALGLASPNASGLRQACAQTTRSLSPAHSVLSQLQTSGAGKQTAAQDGLESVGITGVQASRRMARSDYQRVINGSIAGHALKPFFETAAAENDLPPALLAGLVSRETRGGSVLRSSGFSRFKPPGEGEYGLGQIDPTAHPQLRPTDHAPFSLEHIKQVASILRKFANQIGVTHSEWSAVLQLRGAVAAYNFGLGGVRTIDGMDVGTTGGDYSSDVWARAQFFAENWDGLR